MVESASVRRLLRRWLIEYNPLYLASAACVLVGVNLISSGLTGDTSLVGLFGAAAIAELYAWALIGGAALLMRIGQRRPAVMLALIAAAYQCDVTLHTETSAYLGGVGILAAGLWLASFVAKLYALGWALSLRLSRSAIATAVFGAAGAVVLPRCLSALATNDGVALLALWLFGLFSLAFWSSRRVTSRVSLDAWGSTVLRRSMVATWALWASLALCHVNFWAVEHGLPRVALVPVAMLLSARFVRTELSVFALVGATLLVVAGLFPSFFWLTAAMAAGVLALAALRNPRIAATCEAQDERTPYRTPGSEPLPLSPVVCFGVAPRASMLRLLTGSLFASYLALWTLGWSGGAWPQHILWLDLALTLSVALIAYRTRLRTALVPLAACYFQFGVELGLIRAPDTRLEWGGTVAAVGFVLLIAALSASYRLRTLPP